MIETVKSSENVVLGDIVEDFVTGFTGIAIYKLISYTGEIEFGIQSQCERNDIHPEPTIYINVKRLKVIGKIKK